MATVSKSLARKALKTFLREKSNDGEEASCMRVALEEFLEEVNKGRSYHRPVCTACQVEMYPEKNGVGVLDMADFGPASLWDADLWQCSKCGLQIVSGFGNNPISRHHEGERFEKFIKNYRDYSLIIESR